MTRSGGAAIGVLTVALTLAAQDVGFAPAVYRGGSLPVLPATAVGGGEVRLDVAVDAGGNVTGVTKLRVTPPFTEMFANAVHGWAFRPARDMGTPAPTHVLVALLLRPPSMAAPTLGERPQDAAVPRPELPNPIAIVTPAYPPQARRSGVVLVEVGIDATGRVARVHVVRSAPPFDTAATDAAWQSRFGPARLHGTPVASVAYLAFGFPEIVTR